MQAKRSLAPVGGAQPLRVLLVEDNNSDAIIAHAVITKAFGGRSEVLRAATLAKVSPSSLRRRSISSSSI